MFASFFQGLMLGFGVAVPFGPMNILILSNALKSFKNAFFLGLGAMSADIFYFCLLLFGLLKFLNSELIHKILAIFGFCFLTYLAFLSIRTKPNNLELKESKDNENIFKIFFKGFFLNLSNPYIISFWLSISSFLSKEKYYLVLGFGLFIAILIWVFCLSFFVSKFADKFNAKVLFYINLVSALIIEYFALALLYKTFFAQ